jgi:hypothetical protein
MHDDRHAYPLSQGCLMTALLAGLVLTGIRTCLGWVGLVDEVDESAPPAAPAHDAGSPAPGAPVPDSYCGHPDADPRPAPEDAWRRWACRTRAEAGERWSRCLPRPAYTARPGHGCPGRERCCPPP